MYVYTQKGKYNGHFFGVEIPIGYPQRGPGSTSVYFSSFYLRRMEPENIWV